MANGWKTVAIIFIILFFLETALLVWAYNVGSEEMENEEVCANEICFNVDEASTYLYAENICSCYNDLGETVYRKVMK